MAASELLPLNGSAALLRDEGGGGPPDCAVDCADTIAAAVAAALAVADAECAVEVADAFDEGAASIIAAWRNPALQWSLDGVEPVVFDPNSILNGTPSVDGDGYITVPIKAGISGGTPATGIVLAWPAVNLNGRPIDPTRAFLWAAMRSQAPDLAENNIRVGIAISTEQDPTAARGFGAFWLRQSASTFFVGAYSSGSVGSWTATTAVAGGTGTWAEVGTAQRQTTSQSKVAGTRVDANGLADASGSNNNVVDSNLNLGGGTLPASEWWVYLFVCPTGTGASAQDVKFRAIASVMDPAVASDGILP